MSIELRIRQFPRDVEPRPAPDELLLIPRVPGERGCRALASFALEHGPAGFLAGDGHIGAVIAGSDPTFDEMLAATFVIERLEGRSLPEGCQELARYAALARKGIPPSSLPPEQAIESIFVAVRRPADAKLDEPARTATFVADWQRMAKRLLKAAADGTDPFTVPLFASGSEFAGERAFLLRDREVYRQDVLRGERWIVCLPGGPPQASALLLREPKSLLFKSWSRSDGDAPVGGAYLLLGVDWGRGEWVFSTDPVQRLSLKSLAEALQEAEAGCAPDQAKSDPWFDGAPFDHTLVAAPKAGTKLPDKSVRRIVRNWARATRVGVTRRRAMLATVGAAAAGALGAFVYPFLWQRPAAAGQYRSLKGKTESAPVVVLRRTLEVAPGNPATAAFQIPIPQDNQWPVRYWLTISSDGADRRETLPLNVRVNGGPPQSLAAEPAGPHEWISPRREATLSGGTNEVAVEVENGGSTRRRMTIRLDWAAELDRLPRLHMLAVGVSEYRDEHLSLRFAHRDAEELIAAFHSQQGMMYREFNGLLLTNGQATRANIRDALAELCEGLEPHDLLIVTFSGHGAPGNERNFYFLPHDFDSSNKLLVDNGLSWHDIRDVLAGAPCQKVIFMDTCHSGLIAQGQRGANPEELKTIIGEALARSRENPKGLVGIAACLGGKAARESDALGHGMLSAALLDALKGGVSAPSAVRAVLGDDPVVSLAELRLFLEKQVAHLSKQDQAVVVEEDGGAALELIPIVAIPDLATP